MGDEADAVVGREMAQLDQAERLARAVLLFHRGGPWGDEEREAWKALTGCDEATTRVLCDLARQVRQRAEELEAALRGLVLQLQADDEAWYVVQEWPEMEQAFAVLKEAAR